MKMKTTLLIAVAYYAIAAATAVACLNSKEPELIQTLTPREASEKNISTLCSAASNFIDTHWASSRYQLRQLITRIEESDTLRKDSQLHKDAFLLWDRSRSLSRRYDYETQKFIQEKCEEYS